MNFLLPGMPISGWFGCEEAVTQTELPLLSVTGGTVMILKELYTLNALGEKTVVPAVTIFVPSLLPNCVERTFTPGALLYS